MNLPSALEWKDGRLTLLDQTRLPMHEAYLQIRSASELESAIRRLAVRGAPAIGCAGAFGTVLIARELGGTSADDQWIAEFNRRCEQLAATRPTAVNLRWAVERCKNTAQRKSGATVASVISTLEAEAKKIHEEDRLMCERIGAFGAELLKNQKKEATVITHCNAGALATGGSGTALAVLYAAQQNGIKLQVFADETRPLLQGARLTAWELSRAGIDVTVICDNMAASVLRDRKPDAVIVGADRIAANGDTANKIGTYALAVLARHHRVPFYVAAPSSTFDLTIADGSLIPIEERARDEIAVSNGKATVPAGVNVFNPAFDVTPAALIDAHITEKGIIRPPYQNLAEFLR